MKLVPDFLVHIGTQVPLEDDQVGWLGSWAAGGSVGLVGVVGWWR
jgi:hypothetical protein